MLSKRSLLYLFLSLLISYFLYSFVKKSNISIFKPTVKVKIVNFFGKNEEPEIPFIREILSENYNIKYVEKDYDILLNGFLNDNKVIPEPNSIKIHYTSEAHIGDPKIFLKDYDLIMGFDFIDLPNYIRVPFSYARHTERMSHIYERKVKKCDPGSKKHFACFLVRNSGDWSKVFNGAKDRTRLFHKLSLYKRVASGGKHLNNVGDIVPYSDTEEWLSQCKFVIAYENQYYPGYITEKPFQAWFAGSIPIYNANRDVLKDLNSKAVIYTQDFSDEDELVEYIKKVDNDDELYCKIWNERILTDPNKDYEVLKSHVKEKLNKILKSKLKK